MDRVTTNGTTLHGPVHLEQLVKGDPARVAEWIELYLAEAPEYFKRVEEGAAAGDAKALALAVHELRPQAQYLGAPKLLELRDAHKQVAFGLPVHLKEPLVPCLFRKR